MAMNGGRWSAISDPMAQLPVNSRIEDYAMIGDCRTAALVSLNGSIDWLCLPRFDSGACFAALLGTTDHGRWQIKPKAKATVTRSYLDGSLILETVFKTRSGSVSVTDFMPMQEPHSSVVRIVTGLTGRVAMEMDLAIRFDYGTTVPWVSKRGAQLYTAVAGPDMLTLHTASPLRGEGLRTVAEFSVAKGDRVTYVLTNSRSYEDPPAPLNIAKTKAKTAKFWRGWSNRCHDAGAYSDIVRRSLITLKGLTYLPTGGIVAAATTSLPEEIGGERNWDYRYCWVRDATFTLLAFMNAGYLDEAAAWRDWLMRAVAGSPEQLQIMYGIGGERNLTERQLPWLPGYKNSAPVRVGNAASDQVQLDVYGELMDALAQASHGGLPPSDRAGMSGQLLLKKLETVWREPDNGIWEIRGQMRHFVHYKVMSWLAFHRLATSPGLRDDKLRGHYRHVADTIHKDICTHGTDKTGSFFVQYYGANEVDASLLLLAIVGFLPPDDPRIGNTVRQIEKQLIKNGLVIRYNTAKRVDGLSGTEGAFLACSFWLVDNLVLLGRLEDGEKLFAKLVGLVNDVGLLSEEYDAVGKRMLGNFPQAFSHVALVNSAIGLARARAQADKPILSTSERRKIQRVFYRHAVRGTSHTHAAEP
jgi:GH15 family glucan-1,4-alpha-glucosidase